MTEDSGDKIRKQIVFCDKDMKFLRIYEIFLIRFIDILKKKI